MSGYVSVHTTILLFVDVRCISLTNLKKILKGLSGDIYSGQKWY
jgi:hypothetical protein